MKPDFYEKRTKKLLLSGYPVELSTVDCTTPDAPVVYWHWHDEVEFQYIQKGQAYITCDEDNITVSEGDIDHSQLFLQLSAHHRREYRLPAICAAFEAADLAQHRPSFRL